MRKRSRAQLEARVAAIMLQKAALSAEAADILVEIWQRFGVRQTQDRIRRARHAPGAAGETPSGARARTRGRSR